METTVSSPEAASALSPQKSAKKAAPPVVNASASEAKMEEKISTLKEQVALQQKQLAELRSQVAKWSLPAEIPSK